MQPDSFEGSSESDLEKELAGDMQEEPLEREEPEERQVEVQMEEEPLERQEPEEREFEPDKEEEPLEREELGEESSDFAERFYELSRRRFESEGEVDDSVNRLLNEIERDFFFKGLWKKLKKGGKLLVKKGLRLAKGLTPFKALKAVTQLSRGNLKGLLGSLAKAGLSTAMGAVVPGGPAILPAMKALGFESTEDPEMNRQAWQNFVNVSRESFDYLAENLDEESDNPEEANRLAAEAFSSSLRSVKRKGSSISSSERRYTIRVRPGETVRLRIKG